MFSLHTARHGHTNDTTQPRMYSQQHNDLTHPPPQLPPRPTQPQLIDDRWAATAPRIRPPSRLPSSSHRPTNPQPTASTSRAPPQPPKPDLFPGFNLIDVNFELHQDRLDNLTSGQLVACWIVPHPDLDDTVQRKILRLWRGRRERGRKQIGTVALGALAPDHLRERDPFVGMELADLTWEIPADLKSLTSAELAVSDAVT